MSHPSQYSLGFAYINLYQEIEVESFQSDTMERL